MIPFLVIFAIFFGVAWVALCGLEAPVERLTAVATQPLPEPPTDFIYPSGYEFPTHYSGPVFEDRYEEWHYYRHHLHPDEYLGDMQRRFQEEYNQGIFGLWDALCSGDVLTPEQEDLAYLLQIQLDHQAQPDVIDGTWK